MNINKTGKREKEERDRNQEKMESDEHKKVVVAR